MRSAMSLGLVLAALLAAPGLGSGDATIVFEPWARFDEAATNAPEHAMTSRDAIGDVMLNTLSLHPGEEPTRLVFESVSLPELAEGERLLLIGRVAMRVGISWDDPERIVDGSTFRIDLGGERLLEETVTESIWVPFAVDLGEWAGRSPSLTFETDARESVAYDWAIFGDPIIVHLTPGERRPGPGVWLTSDDPQRGDVAPVRRGQGFAGTVEYAPLEGEFYSFPGRAELESLAPSHPIVAPDEPVRLRARLRSVGRGTVRAGSALVRLDNLTPEAMSLSRLDLPVPEIRPGDVDTVSCVAEMSQGGRVGEIAAWLNGREVLGRLAARPRHPEAIVESGDLAIEVIAAGGGAVGAVIRTRADEGWQELGQIWPLATVWAEPGTPTSANWHPVSFSSIQRRGESVLLTATGDHWRAELVLSPAGDGTIACRAVLTALTPLELRAWRGPTLLGGAGAYGELKDSALFPGIELLVGRERSSDPRHAFPPISDKMVPDPLAITVPLMAVAGDGSWVAMEWDPLREWAPGEALPSARFASPDLLDGHQAHSASLFAPSVPQYVDEDESLAARPYSMETGDQVTLECVLRAGPGDAVDALRAWVERHGLPEPDPARSYADEQRLSRRAWLDTLWSECTAGWAHIVGGDPSFVPAYAVLALRDTYENPHSADAPRLMRRVRRSLDRALAEHGAGVLASRTGAHIMRFEAPFWLGHPIEGTLGAQRMARAMMAGQGFDGVWRWRASDDMTHLGQEGQHVLGTSSFWAATILRYARITGDPVATESGLRALEAFRQYRVPRGASLWECPMFQPDILAAAETINAYVEGYRLTGDTAYLDDAREWAWKGLSFHYLWEAPGVPGMRYAGIPAFGTTHYVIDWTGVPVQWCALVYAAAVDRLARQTSGPEADMWRRVAWGITGSGMHQQFTEGPLVGSYPDSWRERFTEYGAPFINPEDILVGLYNARGRPADVDTAILEGGDGQRVHVTSAATIGRAELTPEGLDVELDFYPGRPAYVLITGAPAPSDVSADGEPLRESHESLSGPGYRHDAATGWTEMGVTIPESGVSRMRVVFD